MPQFMAVTVRSHHFEYLLGQIDRQFAGLDRRSTLVHGLALALNSDGGQFYSPPLAHEASSERGRVHVITRFRSAAAEHAAQYAIASNQAVIKRRPEMRQEGKQQ